MKQEPRELEGCLEYGDAAILDNSEMDELEAVELAKQEN